jgi:methylthioribose-1-phosphate isomerase
MNVDGRPYRSIWLAEDGQTVEIIDQTQLPHNFAVRALRTVHDAALAITAMYVRGAPLIGATAAHGVALAMREDASDGNLEAACRLLSETRPTAVNLRWALGQYLDPLQCRMARDCRLGHCTIGDLRGAR